MVKKKSRKSQTVEQTVEDTPEEPKFISVEHFSKNTMIGDKEFLIVKTKGFTQETAQYLGNVSSGGSILDEDGNVHSLYIVVDGITAVVNAKLNEDILIEASVDSELVKK